MDDRQFERLLAFLEYSRNGYRRVRKGVKKRAARHMSELDCRNMVDFRVHDLLADDPPEKDIAIVFLRNNLLTYCSEKLFVGPLRRIIGALRPGGFLVIGAKETMPEAAMERLTRYEACVFRRT